MDEENKKRENKEKLPLAVKIPLITIICFVIIGGLLFIPQIVDTIKSNDMSYKISLSSVTEFEENTYVSFNIESYNEIEFLFNDFAAMVDGLPITAISINNEDSESYDGKTRTKKSVIVRFNFKKEKLDKPVKFYYKGQLLELGESVKFS